MKRKVGDYYKELRKELKMTLEEFSHTIGLSKSYLNQIEKNERIPSKNKLFQNLCYLNEFQKLDPPLPANEILEIFANQKKLDYSLLKKNMENTLRSFSKILINMKIQLV